MDSASAKGTPRIKKTGHIHRVRTDVDPDVGENETSRAEELGGAIVPQQEEVGRIPLVNPVFGLSSTGGDGGHDDGKCVGDRDPQDLPAEMTQMVSVRAPVISGLLSYKLPLPCSMYRLKSAALHSTAEAPPARAVMA